MTGSKGVSGSCESTFKRTSERKTGATGTLHVTFPKPVSSWKIEITFSLPVTNLTSGNVSNVHCSGNLCSFENKGWNTKQWKENKVEINLTLAFSSLPAVEKVMLDGADLCSGTTNLPQVTTSISGDLCFLLSSKPLIINESEFGHLRLICNHSES